MGQSAWPSKVFRAGEDMRDLVVILNSGTPASQVDIDADILQAEEYNLASINLTVDITASGVNGLDTGSEASSTWYAIWVIYNPTTDTIAGLLSTSETSPTMPGGYTKKRKVGHVRNGSSSNFNDNGNVAESYGDVFHNRGNPAAFDFLVGNFTTDVTLRLLDLSSIVPVGAKEVDLVLELVDNAINSTMYFIPGDNSNFFITFQLRTQVANQKIIGSGSVGLNAGRTIGYWGSAVTFTEINLTVKGWRF